MDAHFQQQIARVDSVHRWLIAHSGGLDSQVLLSLAARHLPAGKLQVIHINHQLQAEAPQWSVFSEAQAKVLGLSHRTIAVSVSKNSENSARDARYQAFEALLQPGDCLLMGHHADDQAETLLFRLLRGAGLTGLSGIPERRSLGPGRIFRPLLQQPRAVLESWAQVQGLEWVEDPSNQTADYDRNYLRLQVMPLLAQRWPGFERRWGQTARVMAESESLLNEYLDRDLKPMMGAAMQLEVALLPLDAVRRSAILRRWLQRKGVAVSRAQLERIERELIGARRDAQPVLHMSGHSLRRYQGKLYCLPLQPLQPQPLSASLRVGSYDLGDGMLRIDAGPKGLKSLTGLMLERRQGGERLHPAGRGGHCSLKKLLQEAGIPPWQRTGWPVLKNSEEIVAVPGICVCEGWQSENDGFTVNWVPF